MGYEHTAKEATIFWQTNKNNEGVGEPALLIEYYSDCIQISQDDQKININYDSVKDLVKILKEAHLKIE